MAKKIEQWEATDHARFDTEDEAIMHDAVVAFAETCRHVGWNTVPYGKIEEQDWRTLALWLIEGKSIVELFFNDLPKVEE